MRSAFVVSLAAFSLAAAPVAASAQTPAAALSLSNAQPSDLRAGATLDNPNAAVDFGWVMGGLILASVAVLLIVILADGDDDEATSP